MSYEHGVRINESSVGARPPVQVDSALPVYVGTAPLHAGVRTNANIPVLIASLAEFEAAFGPVEAEGYTLCEAARLHFLRYETGPIVCICVLNPQDADHVETASAEVHAVTSPDSPTPLTHPGALEVLLLERAVDGEHAVEDIVYTGTGNGTLGAALLVFDDPADLGDYTVTCEAARVVEAYAVEDVEYTGTGNGTLAAILADPAPTADGDYALECTKAAAGLDPAEFQLSKDAVPVGAVVLADGTTQTRGGIAIAIEEGVTPFIVGDDWAFTVATSAVAWTGVDPSDFELVYSTEDGSASIDLTSVDADSIRVTYTWLDPTAVTAADVVGGYSGGAYTGLEVVHQVYPRLLRVPTLVLAPGYSHTPSVAAKIATVAGAVSGQFRALGVVDLTSDAALIATYAAAPAYKAAQGYAVEDLAVCWPQVEPLSGNELEHLSVHVACLCGTTDTAHGGLPYASPSNKSMQASGAVQTSGGLPVELFLDKAKANALNAAGIVTLLQSAAKGWIAWGNRSGVYPADTDPRVAFIAVRRMMNHVHNTIVLTAERDVDDPANRRFIDGVVSTIQAWLNGLVAVGALIRGVIDFRVADNNTTDMSNGKYVFHVSATPPSPAEDVVFDVEYDSSALEALFD